MMLRRGVPQQDIETILPSSPYFRNILREDFSYLRYPKQTRMGKCRFCVGLRMQIQQAWSNQEDLEEFRYFRCNFQSLFDFLRLKKLVYKVANTYVILNLDIQF